MRITNWLMSVYYRLKFASNQSGARRRNRRFQSRRVMSSAQVVEYLEPRELLTASVNIEPTMLVYTGTATVPVTVAPIVSISDTSSTLTSATMTVSSGYQNGPDALLFHNTSHIAGSWNSGTGTLTLSGTTTLANYALALESVHSEIMARTHPLEQSRYLSMTGRATATQ